MDWPDKAKTDYVLYHLKLCYQIPHSFDNYLEIAKSLTHSDKNPFIYFPVSSEALQIEKLVWINEIPVLYPLSEKKSFYEFRDKNLYFNHDIIKSAFYLLSGQQEYLSRCTDHFGRFPHFQSIQKKLGITTKPIVNYYFELIFEAIKEFYRINNIYLFKEKGLFNKRVVMLTHDVDRLERYNLNSLLFKAKQVTGLSMRYHSVHKEVSLLFRELYQFIKFWKRDNPVWDFEETRDMEKKYGFDSVYYFLDKDLKHQDAKYDITEERVIKLMRFLHSDGCEIGLHGTTRSAISEIQMKDLTQRINEISPTKVFGIRQHRLIFKNPDTITVQQKAGFHYDTTLGFAEYEGFRNSFCLPFRMYDHENNKMTDVWEIPLNVMDTTLFAYRQLDVNKALTAVKDVMEEVKKFSGVFTLLWHNGFADEDRWPGTSGFYEKVLKMLLENGFESSTGKSIVSTVLNSSDGE